jgi:hypothetical protein
LPAFIKNRPIYELPEIELCNIESNWGDDGVFNSPVDPSVLMRNVLSVIYNHNNAAVTVGATYTFQLNGKAYSDTLKSFDDKTLYVGNLYIAYLSGN